MAELYLETGRAQLTKTGEELCGDQVGILRQGARTLLVLSDGLGSGVKANILAGLTVKIILHMLKEGATLSEVVETVSGTLPTCRERGLAYATFTILEVQGTAVRIVEFDNPPTIMVRRGELFPWPQVRREVAGKTVTIGEFTLEKGDCLLAVSDGVIHAGVGAVLNLGWQWPQVADYARRLVSQGLNAAELAQWLALACQQLYAGKPGDDASILACRLRPLRTATVLVGPPVERRDDARVAAALQAESGCRIICGGTTSQLVAREWGQELKVPCPGEDEGLPPVASLEGVDLVTEGILTLTRALTLLQTQTGSSGDVKEGEQEAKVDVSGAPIPDAMATAIARERRKRRKSGRRLNAAAALVELLTGCDRIHFLVGRALNPAHQNPRFPGAVAFKARLVEKIAHELRQRGQSVEISYF